jgi:hypothetical protein
VIDLPHGIRSLGTVPIDELELVSVGRVTLVGERHHARIEAADYLVDATVGRHRPSPAGCYFQEASPDGGDRWSGLLQKEAFDTLDDLSSYLPSSQVLSRQSSKTGQAIGTVSGKPPLRRASRDTRLTRRSR